MGGELAEGHLEGVLGERGFFFEQAQLVGQSLDIFAVVLLELVDPELVLLAELLECRVLVCQHSHLLLFLIQFIFKPLPLSLKGKVRII